MLPALQTRGRVFVLVDKGGVIVGDVFGQAFTVVQYVVLGLLAILAIDRVVDRLREMFGEPQDERLRRVAEVFDLFCDQLRQIVGTGPLSQLTRSQVEAIARTGYDLAQRFLSPVWSREEWVEAVLRWYDQQIEVEVVARRAYMQVVPEETRAEIATLRRLRDYEWDWQTPKPNAE